MNAIFVPSGDQAGSPSNAGLVVSCVSLLPSPLITQTSALPVRSLSNAISFVRDHAGSPSNALEKVSSRTPVPSARMTKTSESLYDLPVAVAVALEGDPPPSGDSVGLESTPRCRVRRVAAPPAALTTKMSLLSSASLEW